jgi:UDP-N-acetylglucosamine 4,6-dehydratase/5-epimerase
MTATDQWPWNFPQDQRWLIIGGTGTLGNALMRRLSQDDAYLGGAKHVTIFSRDELKQKDMQKRFPCVRYVIGDIRDPEAVERVVKGHDVVFHFAALKHVDVCEENPDEAVKTNYVGTKNIAQACERSGVKKLIFSSTDKAVDPVNAYGMAKALAEKLLLAEYSSMSYVFRWGNVVGSRGSVIPFFVSKIKAGETVPVTHPEMSRFWIRIDEAVNFMLKTIEQPPTEPVYIPSMRGYPVLGIIQLLGKILQKEPIIKVVGLRPGEKIHECLLHTQDFAIQSNNCEQYSEDQMLSLLEPLC